MQLEISRYQLKSIEPLTLWGCSDATYGIKGCGLRGFCGDNASRIEATGLGLLSYGLAMNSLVCAGVTSFGLISEGSIVRLSMDVDDEDMEFLDVAGADSGLV